MVKALEVHITAPDRERAAAMARTLVEERLAACVNIVDGVRSIYAWQGKIADEAEVLCLVKTRAELLPALEARVRALHPYDVPCVIALPVVDGNPDYLMWIRAETRAPS